MKTADDEIKPEGLPPCPPVPFKVGDLVIATRSVFDHASEELPAQDLCRDGDELEIRRVHESGGAFAYTVAHPHREAGSGFAVLASEITAKPAVREEPAPENPGGEAQPGAQAGGEVMPWDAVNSVVEEYVGGYEDGTYQPNPAEMELIKDAIRGLLAEDEFVTAFSNAISFPNAISHGRSKTCIGERCRICGGGATRKLKEVIAFDDPFPWRYPLSAYVCNDHFAPDPSKPFPWNTPAAPPPSQESIAQEELPPEFAEAHEEFFNAPSPETGTPEGKEDVTPQEVRDTVERLFHTPMNLSLQDWGPLANNLLGAASAMERLERRLTEALRRAEVAEADKDYAEKAMKSDQRLLFAAIKMLNQNGIECGSKALAEAARRVRELETKARESGWQPIDTAPKDGSVFLAFTPHAQVGFQFVATFTKAGRLVDTLSGDAYPHTTLWQPLPSYPNQ